MGKVTFLFFFKYDYLSKNTSSNSTTSKEDLMHSLLWDMFPPEL
jgi:hypothetical protein